MLYMLWYGMYRSIVIRLDVNYIYCWFLVVDFVLVGSVDDKNTIIYSFLFSYLNLSISRRRLGGGGFHLPILSSDRIKFIQPMIPIFCRTRAIQFTNNRLLSNEKVNSVL
jgi:hypothetical protein